MPPADSAPGPIADGELPRLFAAAEGAAALGLAVSGGSDSTALLLLADRWARARDPAPVLHVLTVDHGLRAGARAEAEAVLALSARLGRPARLLVWQHDGAPPAADLQAAARVARYRLLAGAAADLGLGAVLIAHTRDDQAETLLIRLARGSGVRGLAGMAAERRVHGVRFLRPLLDVPKARLVATLDAAGVPFAEDPSNAADRFLRARMRKLMPALAEVGLTADRLAGTARRLARAADAIDRMVDDLRRRAALDHGGVLSADVGALRAAPEEVMLRLLAAMVRTVRPSAYLPRAAPLETFSAALAADPAAVRRRTVAGVVLDVRRDRLWVYAEAGRQGFPVLPLDASGESLWDGRIRVVVGTRPPAGARVVAGAVRPDLPRAAAASLPRAEGIDPAAVRFRPLRQLADDGTDD